MQVAHQAATTSPPATPERAPSDAAAAAAAEGSSDAAAAAAAAQAAKLHSVAKKQKDKIASQKEEIMELRQQVGVCIGPIILISLTGLLELGVLELGGAVGT
jgi:class 3 adenylate cyclase